MTTCGSSVPMGGWLILRESSCVMSLPLPRSNVVLVGLVARQVAGVQEPFDGREQSFAKGVARLPRSGARDRRRLREQSVDFGVLRTNALFFGTDLDFYPHQLGDEPSQVAHGDLVARAGVEGPSHDLIEWRLEDRAKGGRRVEYERR